MFEKFLVNYKTHYFSTIHKEIMYKITLFYTGEHEPSNVKIWNKIKERYNSKTDKTNMVSLDNNTLIFISMGDTAISISIGEDSPILTPRENLNDINENHFCNEIIALLQNGVVATQLLE